MDPRGLEFLDEETPRIIMFCGKGGVGKTTCASTTAVHFALKGYRTLLISTDPAPSLSDMLELDVGGAITPIPSVPGLEVVELDYDDVVEKWKEKFGAEVYELISAFLPVDEDIIEYVAGAPGIDEEFALSYVYDLYVGGGYDVIVWDTAPAGGTLNLLKIEETFYVHLGEAAKMYVRVRSALDALTQGRAKRDPLKIIGEWEQLAKNVLDMMKDDGTRAFLVTIPEALGVNQTQRVADDLRRFGIRVGGVVINHVLTEEAADSDFNRARRAMQLRHVEELEKTYGGTMPVVQLPLQPYEVRGVETLKKVEKILFPEPT
ncbi:MAG: ArsA family ATPase [Candidatus Bathyarchaeota archaeon]|nr:MAG: ArsA family ATPase [Candidatus Bathyarchaeota archaeon]